MDKVVDEYVRFIDEVVKDAGPPVKDDVREKAMTTPRRLLHNKAEESMTITAVIFELANDFIEFLLLSVFCGEAQ